MSGSKWKIGTALAATMLSACATTARPPSALPVSGRPALWKVADADTSIYLYGTIHLLPEGTRWRTPELDEALKQADALVVEVALGDDPAASAPVLMRLGTSPGLPPLADRVPANKREALQKAIAALGYPPQVLDRLETWAAALTLLSAQLAQMGFKSGEGVEVQLTRTIREAGKPISGLETLEQQLGFFDTLSEDGQRTLLVAALEKPEATRKEFQGMLAAWLSGDTKAIARTFDSETALSPELREVLMRRRNAAWAEWIEKRLAQPGTILVAVGAGHLAGPESVQAVLARHGIAAHRVQ